MSLPLKGELTPEKPNSPDFEFTGEVSILIEGEVGTVEIQRSLKGSDFFTLTDTAGSPAAFSVDGVAYNAQLENKTGTSKYRLVASVVDTPINYIICK